MCRAIAHKGGRRCTPSPGVTIRQRVSRYSRRLDAAEAEGDDAQIERWDRLFRKAMADDVEHESRPPLPDPAPTRAGQFTVESTFALN